MSYFISVIIPTYNRENMLPITLDSFINQSYSKSNYEIIVVNNNSTDNTQIVIDKYVNLYPQLIKTIFEPRQGVHYARNSAAKISRADVLYYTDDDMIADINLLKNIVQIFIENPEVASASGKVLPKWETDAPIWIKEHLTNGWLSLIDLGNDDIISEDDKGVFSCHQMIRRDIFFKSGGFNPENTNGEWIGDGETGLNIKVKDLGFKFAYASKSIIYHMIPPSRMTQKYLNKRVGNQGNCDSYTDYKKHQYKIFTLLKLNLRFTILFLSNMIYCLGRIFNKDKKIETRFKEAYFYYYRNRVKYNLKIIFSKKHRNLILKYNWLDD